MYTNLAESSSDSFFSSTSIDRYINIGYLQMSRFASAYQKATVLTTTAAGDAASPGSFRKTTDSGATYTDNTTVVTDGDAGTYSDLNALNTVANGDWIVVGYSAPFDHLTLTLVQSNTASVTLDLSFWDGSSWIKVHDSDGTLGSAKTMVSSGDISWTVPDGWESSTIDGYAGFHIRLEFSGALVNGRISEATVTPAGLRYVALPSDFLEVKQVVYKNEPLEPRTFQEFDFYSSTNTGTPQIFTIRQQRLYMDPPPSESGGHIRIWYYATPTELTASTSPVFVAEFHSCLADYATYRCLTVDGLIDQAQIYLQMFFEGRDQLRRYMLMNKNKQTYTQVRVEW